MRVLKTMKTVKLSGLLLIFLVAAASTLAAQDNAIEAAGGAETKMMEPNAFLKKLVGKWEGNCQTWFQPGKLADESAVKGEFQLLFGGPFVRHTYEGSMKQKPRRGEDTLVLQANQSTYIPLGVKHRLENIGTEPLYLIEVQSGDYLGEDDIVRFEDDYKRS